MSSDSNPSALTSSKFTTTEWLILTVAAIGFLFDTYELLLLPLIAAPALAEIMQLPANHPQVTDWVGRLLWLAALSGGVFGLIGGWLTDRLGRKTVLAMSIALYSLSPVAAAFSTTLEWFVFFRCATFVGVCIEFVAAITWLAELFPDRKRKEKVLGWTQAFASVGGLFVTVVNGWILRHAASLPALSLPERFNQHADWRYLLLTGLLPAIPIVLILPFVPESQVWKQRRAAGTLKRPSFVELFSPALRRTTLVSAALSACAYGVAFGALQLTPTRIVPGLSTLAEQQKVLRPLQEKANELNKDLDKVKDTPAERAEVLKELAANRARQMEPQTIVRTKGKDVQFWQELGGLLGRIALAALLALAISRGNLLRLFLVPGLIVMPLTYVMLFRQYPDLFQWGVAVAGFLTVAQFSYFGEYLPKVFPLHLRGTGGSFATNVGGRMLGTSAAALTTSVVAPYLLGGQSPMHIATASAIVGTSMFALALVLSFLLPEPKPEAGQE